MKTDPQMKTAERVRQGVLLTKAVSSMKRKEAGRDEEMHSCLHSMLRNGGLTCKVRGKAVGRKERWVGG